MRSLIPRRSRLTALITATLLAGSGVTAVAAAAPASAKTQAGGTANTWAPTAGAMSVARSGQTATLLTDGKVRIAGGSTASAELYNPTTRTFAPTGSMSVARRDATATLLQNGEVLVAGGCCGRGFNGLNSAELYDPATGKWTLTGSMVHARYGQTATLLTDGKVLVAGGACNGSAYGCDAGSFLSNQASAELYDPATGTWAKTGSMHVGRMSQTATLLHNGTVLVAGGFTDCDDDFCSDTADAEIYNPATGTWTTTHPMQGAREQHTATLLQNGNVLVAGGLNEGGFNSGAFTLSSAEIYDPATGTWTVTQPMAVKRYAQVASLLKNGWVLVAGGQFGSRETANAQIYEPSRGIWVTPGAMGTPRATATATALTDGQVLVTGGTAADGHPLSTAEVFRAGAGPLVSLLPNALSFSPQQAGSSSTPQTFTVANDGSAPLRVSGVNVSGAHPGDFLASTNCAKAPVIPGATCTVSVQFAPSGTGLRTARVTVADNAPLSPQAEAVSGYGAGPNTWTPTGSMATARDSFTSTLLRDRDVLIAGGEPFLGTPSSGAELYHPATGTFTATGALHGARYDDAAVLLPDGDVLVAGGKGANFSNLATAELYNPATGTWHVTGSMHQGGYGITMTLLQTGKVLVTGLGFPSTAEVYDPASGTWTDTGAMTADQTFGTATLLQNGQVLLAGGGTAVELYDPSTNAWIATGSLNVARQDQTATLLPDGKVLVAGGTTPGVGGALASAEIYDPATGTWKLTGSMGTARFGQTATLLTGGVVMVAGGCTASCDRGPALASTEFFNETYGYWFAGPTMTTPRYQHTATLLANGDLLIAGGNTKSCCAAIGTAELYTSPVATATPSHGPPGQAVTITGRNFFAGEKVRAIFDFSTLPGRATTTSTGSFVLHTTIPSTATPGVHTLEATGSTSFATAVFSFTVS
jgi:N-acetylneuraminic acid mutarotase